jgi:hypothetical protein
MAMLVCGKARSVQHTHTHARMHIHTHAHTHPPTHTHTHTHTRTHACKQDATHTCAAATTVAVAPAMQPRIALRLLPGSHQSSASVKHPQARGGTRATLPPRSAPSAQATPTHAYTSTANAACTETAPFIHSRRRRARDSQPHDHLHSAVSAHARQRAGRGSCRCVESKCGNKQHAQNAPTRSSQAAARHSAAGWLR